MLFRSPAGTRDGARRRFPPGTGGARLGRRRGGKAGRRVWAGTAGLWRARARGRAVPRRRGGVAAHGANGAKSGGPRGAGTRWAAAGRRSAGGGKGGSFCAGVCRVIAPARGGGRKKAAFSHIRKRVFRPLFFVGSELILPENLVLFIGLLFRPRRAMNVSRAGKGEDRRPGAAAAGGKSRRAQGRKPREKPDFRHRD